MPFAMGLVAQTKPTQWTLDVSSSGNGGTSDAYFIETDIPRSISVAVALLFDEIQMNWNPFVPSSRTSLSDFTVLLQ